MNNKKNVFQFRSRDLELEIAGKEFVIDLSKAGSAEALLEIGSEAVNKGKALSEVPEIEGDAKDKAQQSVELLQQAAEFVFEAIDKILGEGAVESIFEGRRKDYFDAIDLLGFLITEINKANAERISERTSQYSNRAQKRAATKKKKA